MTILESDAPFLRAMFIDTFVDTSSDYYKQNIEEWKECSDGWCYKGFLWDTLKQYQPVSPYFISEILKSKPSDLYVFWDLRSKDYIFIEDYWKYPKHAVIRFSPAELPDILATIPEDAYFFDDSLTWAAILTHEERKPGKRLCFYCGSTNEVP